MVRALGHALLVIPASFLLLGAKAPGDPDILLVIADDIGVADLASVPHPNLDLLASRGVTFTAAYANPTCSPTRRSLLFGRYFDHDSGAVCSNRGGDPPALAEVSIAELADESLSAVFGKWHVGRNPAGRWETAPQAHGFSLWRAGAPMNMLFCLDVFTTGTYWRWLRVDDGFAAISSVYNPFAVRDEFASWWFATRGPRLAVVAPALAHDPFHRPDPSLLPPGWTIEDTQRSKYEAMIVALDTLLGDLLLHVDLEEDVVIFVGDNGTPPHVSPDPQRSKTTTFERGIHVPLIVAGPGFPKGVARERLTHAVDVYATIAELVGTSVPPGTDGISLLSERGHRTIVCAAEGDACARSATLKLRRPEIGREELYDLALDPDERTNLLGAPEHAAGEAELRAVLDEFQARGVARAGPPSSAIPRVPARAR